MNSISSVLSTNRADTQNDTQDTIRQLQNQKKRLEQQLKTLSAGGGDETTKKERTDALTAQIQQLDARIQQLEQSEAQARQAKSSGDETAKTALPKQKASSESAATGLIRSDVSYRSAKTLHETSVGLKGRSNVLASDAELDAGRNPAAAEKERDQAAKLSGAADEAAAEGKTLLTKAAGHAQAAAETAKSSDAAKTAGAGGTQADETKARASSGEQPAGNADAMPGENMDIYA